MRLDRAFGLRQTLGDRFDGQLLVVVKQKHPTAHRGQFGDGFSEMTAEFGAFDGETRTRMCFGQASFGNLVQGFGVVLLLSEVVDADVFSDAIHPRGEPRLTTEATDASIRTQPHLLTQVLGNLNVRNAPVDVGIDAKMVFSHQGVKGIAVSGLGGFNEVFFFALGSYILSFRGATHKRHTPHEAENDRNGRQNKAHRLKPIAVKNQRTPKTRKRQHLRQP